MIASRARTCSGVPSRWHKPECSCRAQSLTFVKPFIHRLPTRQVKVRRQAPLYSNQRHLLTLFAWSFLKDHSESFLYQCPQRPALLSRLLLCFNQTVVRQLKGGLHSPILPYLRAARLGR